MLIEIVKYIRVSDFLQQSVSLKEYFKMRHYSFKYSYNPKKWISENIALLRPDTSIKI